MIVISRYLGLGLASVLVVPRDRSLTRVWTASELWLLSDGFTGEFNGWGNTLILMLGIIDAAHSCTLPNDAALRLRGTALLQ
jgi:hypothetical protein